MQYLKGAEVVTGKVHHFPLSGILIETDLTDFFKEVRDHIDEADETSCVSADDIMSVLVNGMTGEELEADDLPPELQALIAEAKEKATHRMKKGARKTSYCLEHAFDAVVLVFFHNKAYPLKDVSMVDDYLPSVFAQIEQNVRRRQDELDSLRRGLEA